MSRPILLTMGDAPPLCRHPTFAAAVRAIDCYALTDDDLAAAGALLVGMHCDQIELERRRPALDAFVAAGGCVVVCGQVTRPFLSGLVPMRWLDGYRLDDLAVRRVAEHPVWDGVDPSELTFRRGVAGFYGRAYWPHPPSGALVVHCLGDAGHPLDVIYRHGDGEVLVHGGNDLWTYHDADDSTARMTPQLLDWLTAR
ncbi:MAG: hypothetical protein M3217_10010 [Actinomycetota bacterium]|nr:hypothetical protein [Actinomycetota bacterium]